MENSESKTFICLGQFEQYIFETRPSLGAFSLFLVFFSSAVIMYASVLSAGMTTDVTGWMERVMTYPWYSFMTPWEYGSFQPFTQLSTSVLYHLFGQNPAIIGLVYLVAHAWIATILCYCLRKMMSLWGLTASPMFLIGLGLVWVTHPYHNEVLVWKVCHHYLFAAGLILLQLWIFLTALSKEKVNARSLGMLLLANLSTLYFKEYGYVVPGLILCIGLAYSLTREEKWRVTACYVGVAIASILLYQAIKAIYVPPTQAYARWAGELTMSPAYMSSNLQLHLSKYLVYSHHWSWNAKQSIKGTMYAIPYVLPTFIFLCGIGILWFRKKAHPLGVLSFTFLAMALLSWAPTSPFYYYDIYWNANDRYGYIGSLFFICSLGVWISHISSLRQGVLLIGLIFLHGYLFLPIHEAWEGHYEVQRHLEKDLIAKIEETGEDPIYILQIPNNYRGIPLYKAYRPHSTIRDQIQWIHKRDISTPIIELDQYNMMNVSDGAFVREFDSLHWKVEFGQWGNWSWHGDMGSSNYSRDNYTIEYRDNGYHLYVKDSIPPGRYIVQDSLQFVDWRWIK